MPCDSGPSFSEIKREQERLDRQARAACEMSKLLRKNDLLQFLSMETQQWVIDHDYQDKLREERERRIAEKESARKSALAKLTDSELRALGLLAYQGPKQGFQEVTK